MEKLVHVGRVPLEVLDLKGLDKRVPALRVLAPRVSALKVLALGVSNLETWTHHKSLGPKGPGLCNPRP